LSEPTSQPDLRAIVLLIAVSVPIWLGLETLIRNYVLRTLYGPLLAELRGHYWPELTPELMADRSTRLAWLLLGVTMLAGIVGVLVLRHVVARGDASATPERKLSSSFASAQSPSPPEAKLRDSLLLLTSIPQVPGLLASLCPLAGAAWTPVLICVALSTAFVVVQGFVGERWLATMRA
jgi:hypothetical protein